MTNEQKEQIREEFDKILSQRLERILNGDSKVLILEKEQIFRDIDSLLTSQKESLVENFKKVCSLAECEAPDEGKNSRAYYYHIAREDYHNLITQNDTK